MPGGVVRPGEPAPVGSCQANASANPPADQQVVLLDDAHLQELDKVPFHVERFSAIAAPFVQRCACPHMCIYTLEARSFVERLVHQPWWLRHSIVLDHTI